MWHKSPGRWWDAAFFFFWWDSGISHGENPWKPRLKSRNVSLFFNRLKNRSFFLSFSLEHLIMALAAQNTGLLAKAWWLDDIGLECLIEQKLKDLCLQVSKHIKLILFLNYLIDRTCPNPKSVSPTFSLIHSHQSWFAVDVPIPERALRPAQSTSRPAETALPQRSGWVSLVCTVNLSGRSIHSQKEVFKLGLQNCLILGRSLGILW